MDNAPITCPSLRYSAGRYPWLSIAGSRLVVNPVESGEQPVPPELAGGLTLDLAYYVGERPVRLPSFWSWRAGDGFSVAETLWSPDRILTRACAGEACAEATTFMPDEASVAQVLRVVSQGGLTLSGRIDQCKATWDHPRRTLLLEYDGYSVAVSFGREGQWQVRGAYWVLEFGDLSEGARIAAVARFAPSAEPLPAGGPVELDALDLALQRREQAWDEYLSLVPHPADFALRYLNRPEATPEAIRRMYYKAWVFMAVNILPETPENGYPYPQVACGKPSLWPEGHPKARPSCQWESFIAMQFLAGIMPEVAWRSFEGMLSLVDEDGSLGGEGLPSRHMQTAWVLYSATGEEARLRAIYPTLKRMLLWKARDPRWIYWAGRDEGTKDSEFVVHALQDMLYAKRIVAALGIEGEEAFWDEQIAGLRAQFEQWFWETPGGVPYWQFDSRTGVRSAPNHSWCLQGLVLPPEILGQAQRESLMKSLRGHFTESAPFIILDLTKHPTYNFTMLGAQQYGTAEEASRMAEAAMSAVTLCGEFAECYTDTFPVGTIGVTPSVFGAANIIDACLWERL